MCSEICKLKSCMTQIVMLLQVIHCKSVHLVFTGQCTLTGLRDVSDL